MTNGVLPAGTARAQIVGGPVTQIDPTCAEKESDMSELVVINWQATDAYIDVQAVEKNLAAGTIPRFALEGAGRLRMRVHASYDSNGVTGTITPKLYTTPAVIDTAGTLVWTSAGRSAPFSAATGGFLFWDLELIALPQIDGTFKQWVHSVITIKPDSGAAVVTLEEWTLVAISLADSIDFYASLVNSSGTPLCRVCAVEARISPPRSGS